ncbi:alpha-glucosidase/alpha-galactosidase [Ruthenibacterium lactatiformans]|nr:alpha-glucosidase/alpha-galactosidase [Ruthenibacterium lactatiformans]
MVKVSVIGAGSGFGRRISCDIMARMGKTHDVELALCDIDAFKLNAVKEYLEKVKEKNGITRTKVTTTLDRKESLMNADFVLLSVSIGGPAYFGEPYESEVGIPEKYGITQPVADTMGPGAIFRCMRTAPEMIRMVEDVNRYAPNSMILNLTNPMAMLTAIVMRYAKVPVVGLCHGVSYNCNIIAERLGIPREEIDFICAGINHMTWFIQARHNGKDILPEIRDLILNYKHVQTGKRRSPQDWASRSKILREFGWFTTESDRHIVEYVPWFQNDDHKDLYEYSEFTKGTKEQRQSWYADTGVTLEQEESMELVVSHEAASGIIEAVTTGKTFVFSANVMNDGYITNLPRNCIVEVPCTVDGNGLHPHYVGEIPTQCAALCQTNINEQLLMIEACCEQDKQKAFMAMMLDPECCAKLNLTQMRQMFEEMWAREEELGIPLLK